MSLAQGRSHMAISGPLVIPDAVLQAMHRPAPDIYGAALATLTVGLIRDLARVARTRGNVAIHTRNGHGVWQAAHGYFRFGHWGM